MYREKGGRKSWRNRVKGQERGKEKQKRAMVKTYSKRKNEE